MAHTRYATHSVSLSAQPPCTLPSCLVSKGSKFLEEERSSNRVLRLSLLPRPPSRDAMRTCALAEQSAGIRVLNSRASSGAWVHSRSRTRRDDCCRNADSRTTSACLAPRARVYLVRSRALVCKPSSRVYRTTSHGAFEANGRRGRAVFGAGASNSRPAVSQLRLFRVCLRWRRP